MERRALLRAGAAIAALAISTPSFGQEATRPSVEQDRQIEEIIVTARKRNESLQSVPVAISAISAAGLDKQQITSTEDLNLAVPGLLVARLPGAGNISQIYLRGAGQDDSQAAVESPIGIYIDGVPYTKSAGALLDMIEFERIEVLRGPQGTLYGRNSTGGAIKYITKRPSLNKSRFVGDMTLGSFNRLDIRGSYTTPLTSNFAIKIDAISRSDDGFVKDARANDGSNRPLDLNQTGRVTGRLAALWQISEQWEVYATIDKTRDRSGPQSGIPFISGALADNLAGGTTINRSAPLYGTRKASPELTNPNDFDGSGAQVTITHTLPEGIFTSTLGQRAFKLYQGFDTDGGPSVAGLVSQNGRAFTRPVAGNYLRNWRNNTLTWEGQFASNLDGPIEYVVGVFAMRERNKSLDYFGTFSTTSITPATSAFDFDQTTNSLAAYGEVVYTPIDRLELTAGGRYTRDEKKLSRTHSGAFGQPVFTGVAYAASSTKEWTQFTPRVIARYSFTDDLSAYASYARGYQAGAFQSLPFGSAASSNTPFDPTKVATSELGVRAQWFDRKLTTNATVFKSVYTDLPSTVISLNGAFVVLTNDVEISGVELEAAARPTPGLTVYANAAFLEDNYNRSVVAASPVPGSNGVNRLKYTPEMTYKIGFDYDWQIEGVGRFNVGANIAHSGDYFMSTVNQPFAYQKAFTLVDAQMGYEIGDGKWRVTLAGKNLTDVLYAPRGSTGGGGVLFFAPPKTWSLTLKADY